MPNSYLQYTADGADTKTGIAIPTFKKEEIKVRVDGVLKTEGSGQDYEITSYSTSSFTINWKDTARPTSPSVVRVYRITDILNNAGTDVEGKATYQAGSSVKAGDLNDNQKQVLRALEEENEHLIQSWDIQDGSVTSAKLDTNIDIAGTLDVTGATTLDSTLSVAGTTTAAAINASGAVGVDGNFDVNTNKFTVAASSGDTTIAGTLGVTGNTTLTGAFTANGGAAIDNIQIGVTGDNEIDTQSGNLTIDSAGGTVTIDDNLTVTGDISVSGTFNANTIDGLDSSQFLRSDATDTFTGTELIIADNKHLQIGTTGGGFSLHRDTIGGSGMFLTETGMHVYYAGTNGSTFRTGANQKDVVKFVNSGSRCKVELYEGADSLASTTKRLETTSTGVTITGELKTTTLEIGGTDVTSTANELNILDGVTADKDELNLLDGVTATTTELNYVDGVTSNVQTQLNAKQPLDAELTTLAGMQSGTASILASGTALTSTTAELNLLDGKSIVTSVSGSSTDVQLPTAKAVNDQIVNLLNEAGGFVPIANEVSFPNANPDPNDGTGTIVSIADAGGVVVNGSGVSTTGRTLGGATVTINGIDSSLYNTTIAAGKGMLVQTTSTLNTYTYHRLVVDEAGVANAQSLVSDFNERYRTGSSNPTSSLDDGDLFFNTSSNKMLVYNASDSSWDDVQSVGNYFINTISSYSGTGGNSATFNGSAYRFVLSNAGTYAQQHLVSINGVIQKPNAGTSQPSEGFAIDGSSIIFSNAPASGADYFIITIGAAVNIGTPGNNTVSTATLQNLAVTGDKVATNLDLDDNKKIRFGTGNDLELYSDGTDSYISHTSGDLYLYGVGTSDDIYIWSKDDIYLSPQDGESGIKVSGNGSVELYYDNVKKLETTSGGGTLTGDWTVTNDLFLNDSGEAVFGTGADLKIYHDGTDSYIVNATNQLIYHSGTDHKFRVNDGNENSIWAKANGAVEIYYDGSKKVETASWGTHFLDDFGANDDLKLLLGNGNDLQVWHDGSSSIIKSASHPLVYYANTRHHFVNGDGSENVAVFTIDGSCDLYYDGAKKLETTNTGAKVTGYLGLNEGGTLNSHYFRSSTTNQWAIQVIHDTGGDPYGIYMGYTSDAPDDTIHEWLRFDDNSASRFRVRSDGDVWTSDDGVLSSDRTLKENIVDASPKLDDLMKLKVRNFTWKKEFHPAKEGHKKIGFIAQEVEEVFPKLVSESNIAPLGKPDVMKKEIKQAWAPILVKALQEAVEKIETLETKVAALEAK